MTGIFANGGEGYDYIEIGPGITSPVTLTGGEKRDWLLYKGVGDAVLNGGEDDDELSGGYGTNLFVMENGFGRDLITSLSGRNKFDLSNVTESLTGTLASTGTVLAPSGYNRRFLGIATVNGKEAALLPLRSDVVTAVQANHGLSSGQKVRIVSPEDPAYTGEFTVGAVTEKTFTFQAFNFGRELPAGTYTKSGNVFHDGVRTAYIQMEIPNWKPNHVINLESSTNAYNGPFVANRVDNSWYSFEVDWADVRESLDTTLLPMELKLGAGDDHLTIPGDLNCRISLFGEGGSDTLQIVGGLGEIQTILLGQYDNHRLNILWAGLERLELVDPLLNMRIVAPWEDVPIEFGNVSLGIVARSLELAVDLTADDFEVNVRESLSLAHQLNVNELDLRVFGDHQHLTVAHPIVATTAQLTAPDGTVSIAGNTHFTGHTLAIRCDNSSAVPEC